MIKSINLKNFRLFTEKKLTTNNSLVIFSGKNATGKTSILEAIYLCSTSKSHRTNDSNNIILDQEDFSICEITADKKFKVVLSKNNKAYFINKQEIKKASDFIGNLSVVLFSPFDLNLINGSKSDKRKFLDLEISLLDKDYLKYLSKYKKILQERNNLLKEKEIDKVFFYVITEELIKYLDLIYKKRIEFISKLNEYLYEISKELNIESISLKYNKTYEDNILKSFKNKENIDFATKVTNIGIHRDDFKILINNLPAEEYASEGQSRIICIIIKLALKEYIKNITGKEPILLLDDVFAALDKERIEKLTKFIKKSKQAFITTTSILEIPDELLRNAMVLRIEKEKGD